MGLFKTSEKDVLAYLNKLSEEEKAALLEKAKAATSETDEPKTEEGKETPAETPAAESAPEGTDTAPAAAEGAESPAEEPKPTEGKPAEAAPESPAIEPAQAEPTPTAAPGVSAEALAALDSKYAAQISNMAQQLEGLNAFVESLKQKDTAEKEGIGFQKAQSSQKAGQESYEDVLFRQTGIDRRLK
jgi:hypothetical protein